MGEWFRELKFRWDRLVLFTTKDQLEFMAMFNSFLAEGDGLIVALESTKESYSDVYGDDYVVVTICHKLIEAVKKGRGFDELMAEKTCWALLIW